MSYAIVFKNGVPIEVNQDIKPINTHQKSLIEAVDILARQQMKWDISLENLTSLKSKIEKLKEIEIEPNEYIETANLITKAASILCAKVLTSPNFRDGLDKCVESNLLSKKVAVNALDSILEKDGYVAAKKQLLSKELEGSILDDLIGRLIDFQIALKSYNGLLEGIELLQKVNSSSEKNKLNLKIIQGFIALETEQGREKAKELANRLDSSYDKNQILRQLIQIYIGLNNEPGREKAKELLNRLNSSYDKNQILRQLIQIYIGLNNEPGREKAKELLNRLDSSYDKNEISKQLIRIYIGFNNEPGRKKAKELLDRLDSSSDKREISKQLIHAHLAAGTASGRMQARSLLDVFYGSQKEELTNLIFTAHLESNEFDLAFSLKEHVSSKRRSEMDAQIAAKKRRAL